MSEHRMFYFGNYRGKYFPFAGVTLALALAGMIDDGARYRSVAWLVTLGLL